MIAFLKKWRIARQARIDRETAMRLDGRYERLRNSARGFSGSSHYGPGPFLSINEIRELISRELAAFEKEYGEHAE